MARDADPLLFTGAELVRKSSTSAGRQPHKAECLQAALAPPARITFTCKQQGFFDNASNSHARVQRSEWLLEHHLKAGAQRSEARNRHRGDILAQEGDAAAGRLDQSQ
jgi:hypothetical protein